MRPPTPTPGHAGIPSTEGYSRDLEGLRQWLEDVQRQADAARFPTGYPLNRLQRWALDFFGLRAYLETRERQEFARGRLYVANTALSIFLSPSPAPKGWGSTD